MELSKENFEMAGCLRRLVKNRFLLKSRNEKWFQILIDYREKVEKALDPFLVKLDINESLGVAYLRPLNSDIEESISYQLGRKKVLSALTSLLVFKLRHMRLQYFLNPGSAGVPLVSFVELREFCQNFNTFDIDSQFERALKKSVEELLDLQILQETQAQPDLFEITGVCDILLPADQIQETKIKIDSYFSKPFDGGEANA